MFRFQTFPFRDADAGTTAGASGGGGAAGATGATGDATGTNGGATTDAKTFTQEDLDRIIGDRLKRERDSWEAKATAKAEAERKKAEDAQKPELDRLKAENESFKGQLSQYQQQVRDRDAKDAVSEAARKAGAADASPIWKLVKGDLEYDDDGKITNLDAALKDAKALAPQLFKPASGKADAGAGATTRTASKKSDWMREALDGR